MIGRRNKEEGERGSGSGRRWRLAAWLAVCALLVLGIWRLTLNDDEAAAMVVADTRGQAPAVERQSGAMARRNAGLSAADDGFRRRVREGRLDVAALRRQFAHDTEFERQLPQLLLYWRLLDAIDDFRDFHDAMPPQLRAARALEILVELPAQLRGQRLLPAEAVSLASALLPMTQLPDDAYRRIVEDIADSLFSEEAMPASPVVDPRAGIYQREASRLIPDAAGDATPQAMTTLDGQLLALRRSIYGTAVR